MPKISCTGVDDLNIFLSQFAEYPEEVQEDMINAMTEVAAKAQKETGRFMNIYDPEWTGKHVLDSISVKKAAKNKDGVMTGYITFNGSRTRGETKTRNAEIAFINEFGADRKGITARPFIQTANEKNIEKICQAGEKVFNRWIDKIDKEK